MTPNKQKRKRSIATWRQVKKNGFYESGVIYNNKPQRACDEIYFKWIVNGQKEWCYEMTLGEALIMIRGLSSVLYYKIAKDEVKKWGKLLNKNNPL